MTEHFNHVHLPTSPPREVASEHIRRVFPPGKNLGQEALGTFIVCQLCWCLVYDGEAHLEYAHPETKS